jgi:hypothetical protein
MRSANFQQTGSDAGWFSEMGTAIVVQIAVVLIALKGEKGK